MTKPNQWTCDLCHKSIKSAAEGYVVWKDPAGLHNAHDIMIIHQAKCDPGSGAGYASSYPLTEFLGTDGLTTLLSWLSVGPIYGPSEITPTVRDLDEFVDFVRRVQIPYYEEARPHFGEEKVQHALGDASESYPYHPDVLKRIADGTVGE